ncbi:MAG: hypothetical protein R3E39_23660 [Anaerolineae bacterium]
MQPITNKPAFQSQRLAFQCDQDLQIYLQGLGEAQRLDYLIAIALTDEALCEWLLAGDKHLSSNYGFSASTCLWLAQMKAESLEELAREILASDGLPINTSKRVTEFYDPKDY